MSVKYQNRLANSVDPDEMAHYEPSHQDLHRLQRYPVWSARLKDERGMDTLSELGIRKLFCLPSEKVHPKRKEFAPIGSTFFSFTVEPFLEGVWCAGEKKANHKSI